MNEVTATSRNTLIGTLLVLASAITFSAKAVFIKLAYRYQVDPVTLLALRMAFSLPFFAAAALWSRRRQAARLEPRQWLGVVFLALAGFYLAALCDFLGLQYVSAGLERVVLFLYPTLVTLITVVVYRRPLRGREGLALVLGYGGMLFVFLHDLRIEGGNVPLGTALVFGSALAYAVYLVGTGELVHRIGPMRFTAYVMGIAALAVLAQFLLTRPLQALAQPLPVYLYAAAMGVVSTVAPMFLMSAGIKRIAARRAAMIAAVGPVSTIALAAVFLGEPISLAQLLGTALVLGGVLLVSR